MKLLRPINPLLAPPRGLEALRKYGAMLKDGKIVRDPYGPRFGEGGTRTYTFDANMQLDDGTTAHAAAGWGQVGGAQAILDLGGNQGVTYTMPSISNVSSLTPQQPRIDAVAVIYVSALTLSGSDLYRLSLVGSNNAGLNVAAGNIVLGQLQFGEGSAMDCPNAITTTAPLGSGKYPAGEIFELPFTNEQYGQPYEFLSMYVSGTFGSITASAFVAVLPRE